MISNGFTRWLAAKLYSRCLAVTRRREPDLVIDRAEDGAPYMKRWWLIPRNRWFNIYLHDYLADDSGPELHDHSWWSVSLCLDGVLREVFLDRHAAAAARAGTDEDATRVRDIWAGAIVFRSARFAHRLLLPARGTVRGATTLFITGPRIRPWGFLCRNAPGGWVPQERYLAVDATGRVRGCGES